MAEQAKVKDPVTSYENGKTISKLMILPVLVMLAAGGWAAYLYTTEIDVSEQMQEATTQSGEFDCPAISDPGAYEVYAEGTGSPADEICPEARSEREDDFALYRNIAVGAAAVAVLGRLIGSSMMSRARTQAERIVAGGPAR